MKITPTGYDAEKRQVLVPGGACDEHYFIRRAVVGFKRYGDPDLLLWAIDNGLPGLMENKAVREVLGKLVSKVRPHNRNREADEKREEILRRVWFHRGRGFPFHHDPGSNATGETACSLTAREVGRSTRQVYRVWRDAGGRHPQGAAAIAAVFWESEGKALTTK